MNQLQRYLFIAAIGITLAPACSTAVVPLSEADVARVEAVEDEVRAEGRLMLASATTGGRPTALPTLIVAEGEKFNVRDSRGWKLTPQDESWASHSYGGMWSTHGALIGAPANSSRSVATQTVDVPAAGLYRVWSKYQSMPYFAYDHKVEIIQNGKKVYSHVYGKIDAPRFYSFAGAYKSQPIAQCWWPWGVDHDAAEAPNQAAQLEAGPAEIRLVTVASKGRSADRMVDFILLTSNLTNDYIGYQPYRAGSPFTYEALSVTQLYMRFKNNTAETATLNVHKRIGHYQPIYSGWSIDLPETAEPGQWSNWYNIGPHLNLLHDEPLHLTLQGAAEIPVQFALDPDGQQIVGDVIAESGNHQNGVVIPMTITWNRNAEIKTSFQHAKEIVHSIRNDWRTANNGQKPQHLAYFGHAGPPELKDALGYNTLLSDDYDHLPVHGYHTHRRTKEGLKDLYDNSPNPSAHRVISFGDEIGLGSIDYNDPEMQSGFVAWLIDNGITSADLGMSVDDATLTRDGDPRLAWYSNLFNEETTFAQFAEETRYAEELFGPQVFTGANYSPHHLALCYGPVFQWVDLFKHRGMSMFWSEDYIFSIPEAPQILSWMMATARSGVKYHDMPIHMYIMPHAPAQAPEYLRRNLVFAIGAGADHIDSFLVGPMGTATENFVSWTYPQQFRVLHESIFDSAEAEQFIPDGKMRPAKVAVVISKATDYNESRVFIPGSEDPFGRQCDNTPEQLNQIICRKDQQMLYLALRHAQVGVDLITEDDIVDLDALENYEAVYFAGEWIDHRIVPLLDQWVQRGGVLYATAGLGRFNEYNETDPALFTLLGLRDVQTEKNIAIIRTLLELPLVDPIDTIHMDGKTIPAVGMRQRLTPDTARVIARWSDGSPAATERRHGRGRAIAVGTLIGNSYMKSALRPVPFARGGNKELYNPTDFNLAATKLAQLGVTRANIDKQVVCSNPHVEANVIDSPRGTLITLTNWTNDPRIDGLTIKIKLPFKPQYARSVEQQGNVSIQYRNGVATITTDLTEADYILLPK